MRATDELRREHQEVERLLDRLDSVLVQPGGVPTEFLRQVVAFCRTVVDRCHHGKEEGCLFPCLERRGIPREGGPIGVMLEEHEVLRGIVQRIAGRLESVKTERTAEGELLDLCREYGQLLRVHIAKENEVLVPMAAAVLDADDDAATGECYSVREAAVGPEFLRRARAALQGQGESD